jgi:hypothetical protein
MPRFLTFLALAVAVAAAIRWWLRSRAITVELARVSAQRTSAVREASQLHQDIARLQAQVTRLAQWETVADAAEAAARLTDDARRDAARIASEATAAHRSAEEAAAALRKAAEDEATRIRADARERAEKSKERSQAIEVEAESRAQTIVAEANRKAEEVAGDALKAVREAKELERAVRAFENRIEGYGDRYIIPTHTLLDDLAEGFAHTDAGQKLKSARERVRTAVADGKAATCDYVEENRRTTAIRFVTDAFNGKADSILARVRSDNFGTLRQELHDASALVNHNGEAFRNARINESYLALREDEIRWAAVVHELKEQEREEQRRIKEQLREEEKARREYERAMKEAARDEEALQRALAKVTEQIGRATEEQKIKYETQLAELQVKLKEAEDRSKRAMSMAEQTRRGHVYVISNVGSFGDDVYKIGLTRRLEPLDRIRELGDSSVPFEFDVHALIFADDAPALEARLHRHFVLKQVNKVNYRKEFFRLTVSEIRSELESLGLSASWTMTAAAREYRESLSIEKAIAADPAAREAWLKRQLLLEPVGAVSAVSDDVEVPTQVL